MRLFSRILDRFVRKRYINTAVQDLFEDLRRAFRRSSSTDWEATSAQMRSNTSWVFAANRQIAGRGARVPLSLFLNSRQGTAAPEKLPIYDHPWLDLVGQPNRNESGMVFRWRQFLQLNTVGRYYARVTPEVLDLTKVVGKGFVISRIKWMHLLNPDRVSALYDVGDREDIVGYEWKPDIGVPINYPIAPTDRAGREEWKRQPYTFVFPVVMPAPDSVNGQAPVGAAKSAITISRELNTLNENQIGNGLHAGLIFFLLTEMQDTERFKNAVLMMKTGIGKAGEPLVFPKKLVEIEKNPLTNKDMEYPGLAEASRREQLAVLGASDGLIGLVKDVNRANLEGLERIIAIGTVDPMNALITDGYNQFLLPLYRGQSDSSWYTCETVSSARESDTDVAKTLEVLTGKKPILTQNDARAKLGLPPLPGGDMLTAAQPTGAGSSFLPKTEEEDEDRKALPPGREEEGRDLEDLVQEEVVDEIVSAGSVENADLFEELAEDHPLRTEEGRRDKWREIDEGRRPMEAALRKALSQVFRRWKEAVIAKIQKDGPDVLLTRQDPEKAFDEESWREELAAVAALWLLESSKSGAEGAYTELGLIGGLPAGDIVVDQFVEREANRFAGYVVETQMSQMETSLTDAVLDELGVDDTAAALGDTFPNANNSRTRAMATNVVGAGLGFGVFEATKRISESKVMERIGKMWLSQRDDRVRDTHTAADGQVVEVNEAFVVGGCLMRWPLDGELCGDPGEIINCRCTMVPVAL